MNKIVPVALLALSMTALGVRATDAPARTPLSTTDCIRTERINEWHIVDARRAIVRTGPKRYLVTLQTDCPQLNHPPGLIFSANPSNAHTNEARICGEVGETVRSVNPLPCAIKSVELIDQVQFDKLKTKAERSRDGAARPATEPVH